MERTLCNVPIVGGAIGGALAGMSAAFFLYFIKGKSVIWQKLLFFVGILIATFLAAHLLVYPLAGILYSA